MDSVFTDENVASMDAGVEPTGKYLRRVSAVSTESMLCTNTSPYLLNKLNKESQLP